MQRVANKRRSTACGGDVGLGDVFFATGVKLMRFGVRKTFARLWEARDGVQC